MSDATEILRDMDDLGLFIVWHHAPPLGTMKVDFTELQTADGKQVERKTGSGAGAVPNISLPMLNELIAGGYVHRPLPITAGTSVYQITAKGRMLAGAS